MASIISHIAIPLCLRLAVGKTQLPTPLLALGMLAAVLPDADVMSFKFGIPYESDYGHRGFTHSIVFALALAAICTLFFRCLKASRAMVFTVIFLSSLSHALLDALTNGGLGVALLWPFDGQRIFLPWSPIEVSPIGVRRFMSERGLMVLWSEFKVIWLPGVLAAFGYQLLMRNRARLSPAEPKT